MADVPELHLVQNRCGGMSLVYEGRAYKLKRVGTQKYWRCSKDKKGCGGAIWTNLDVTSVIKRNDHIESCPVDEHLLYKMEEKASAMYGHRAKRFPKLPNHRRVLQIPVPFRTTKVGEDLLLWQSASKHILVFATGYNIRLLAAMRTWGMDDIGTYGFKSQALIIRAAALEVDLNPDTNICDFETALIPAIQGYFPNARAVHRKAGELGLKTRYPQHEETRRKIRMLLATAFLPVPHVNTGVSLLEAGTTGTLAALFQYFRQEWMTDERLPLWDVHNLQLLIAEQGVMDTLIQQVLSGNVTVGDLRRLNRVYAQKQRQVAQYTGEYTNVRRTLKQFLEALMYIPPEPI
ncbi:hypothetical protein T08_15203 [Trichinella sp. T8]|nr:hypothetical protein T08_15203 [Trichinella sp. T8]